MANNVFSINWGPAAPIEPLKEHVEKTYTFTDCDPLELAIWWRQIFDVNPMDELAADNSGCVQRLSLIADVGGASYSKVIPGVAGPVSELAAETAKKVREHFTQRFVMMALTNRPLTRWRSIFARVLQPGAELTIAEIPMLVKAYDFYLEDLAVEAVIKTGVSVKPHSVKKFDSVDQVYTVITNTPRITKKSKHNRWWMRGEDGTLLQLVVEPGFADPALRYMFQPGNRWHISSEGALAEEVRNHRDFYIHKLTSFYDIRAPESE